MELKNSLVVRWLRLCIPNPGPQVQSLVVELRSHMLSSAAKKKPKIHKDYNLCASLELINCYLYYHLHRTVVRVKVKEL